MALSDSPGQHAGAQERARPGFAQNTIERLFEFSPDAILVSDGNGVMRAANPRAEELFGYASEELIGQPVEMLVPARFRGGHPRHRENYSAHPRTRQMGAALYLYGLRKDGTEVPVDIMLKPIETADGPAVVTFIRDATEQRAAQEALRLNDARLRSIVESIGEYAIYMLDREYLACTIRDSLPRKIWSRAVLPNFCARPSKKIAWKKRDGACARTAPASGPAS